MTDELQMADTILRVITIVGVRTAVAAVVLALVWTPMLYWLMRQAR